MKHCSSVFAVALALITSVGCGSSTPGSTGTGGSSGSGGGETGGASGSGGAGTGGASGSGGSGGNNVAGSGGGAGSTPDASSGGQGGGAGSNPDGGTIPIPDASPSTPDSDPGRDVARDSGGTNPSGSLEDCFAGLPAPVGLQQIDTKASADGRVRLRMALDTENNAGLGNGWVLIRFGVIVDGVLTCVKDRAQLMYTPSHHNCLDTAQVTAGAVRYQMTHPNFASMQISALMGAAPLWGPTTLLTTTCTATTPNKMCARGGPCQ
jgi:hypothetical protein